MVAEIITLLDDYQCMYSFHAAIFTLKRTITCMAMWLPCKLELIIDW